MGKSNKAEMSGFVKQMEDFINGRRIKEIIRVFSWKKRRVFVKIDSRNHIYISREIVYKYLRNNGCKQ